MLAGLIVSILLLTAAIMLLGVRVFFVRNGNFPDTHIGSNKAMREKGISCAASQDRRAQKDIKRLNTADVVKQITENN